METNPSQSSHPPAHRPYLGVFFRNCRAYGRLYRNRLNNAYTGFCPKCGRPVRVPHDPAGIDQRLFEFECSGS